MATHIRPQSLGDPHRAVRLEVVFQEGDEHPGRGYAGVVQRVAQLHSAVFVLVADLQAAGLGTFLTTIIDFILVAFVIFLMVKAINAFHKKKDEAPAPEEPAGPTTEELLTEIRDLLKEQK